mmetsp:Transcript_10807/g.26761  ORF Transcript_10807/g.26761 Transcript_10807/m.26761 type:complete len:202 (+) Transcript_10807:2296-2901(+)
MPLRKTVIQRFEGIMNPLTVDPSRNCSTMTDWGTPLVASRTSLASNWPCPMMARTLSAAAPGLVLHMPRPAACASPSRRCSTSASATRLALLPMGGLALAQPAPTMACARFSPPTMMLPKLLVIAAAVSSSSNVTAFPTIFCRTNSLAGQAKGSSLVVPSRLPRRGPMMPARVIWRSGGGPPTGCPMTMIVSALSTALTVP